MHLTGHLAVGRDHRDILRRKIVPGARDQVGNRTRHLIRHAHAAKLQDHRRLRRALAFREQRFVRQAPGARALLPRRSWSGSCVRVPLRAPAGSSLFPRNRCRTSWACRTAQSPSARCASGPCEATSSRALSSSIGRNQNGRAVTRNLVVDILRGQILRQASARRLDASPGVERLVVAAPDQPDEYPTPSHPPPPCCTTSKMICAVRKSPQESCDLFLKFFHVSLLVRLPARKTRSALCHLRSIPSTLLSTPRSRKESAKLPDTPKRSCCDLHHQFKSQIGLLHCDHGRMHVLAVAVEHARHLRVCLATATGSPDRRRCASVSRKSELPGILFATAGDAADPHSAAAVLESDWSCVFLRLPERLRLDDVDRRLNHVLGALHRRRR